MNDVKEEKMKEGNSSFCHGPGESKLSFDVDDFFDFSTEDPMTLEWISKFIEMDDG